MSNDLYTIIAVDIPVFRNISVEDVQEELDRRAQETMERTAAEVGRKVLPESISSVLLDEETAEREVPQAVPFVKKADEEGADLWHYTAETVEA